ncbi:hypothetical protein ACN2XU_18400 [Primorskyibacter sp. 2E107]
MKAMITGFAVAALIGVAAYYGLHEIGFSSADRASSDAVRLN